MELVVVRPNEPVPKALGMVLELNKHHFSRGNAHNLKDVLDNVHSRYLGNHNDVLSNNQVSSFYKLGMLYFVLRSPGLCDP